MVGKKIALTPDAPHTFQCLKLAFTNALILKLPDPSKPFIVEVDASEVGLGAVLSQHQGNLGKLHPCALFSCKVTLTEHDNGNRKLLAVKAALE